MRTSNFRTSLVLTAALGLSACVSTSLVDHWKDASYGGPALHKVLVVGVQKDQGRRRVWEDGMVTALGRQGVQAEPSYQVFPDKVPAPEELTSVAARDGFDAVAATHFVMATQHTRVYNDGFGYPYGYGYGYGWRHRGFWGPAPYGPYAESEIRTDYQTDVFTVDGTGGKLIWTGVTRSLDPSSTRNVTDEISRVLVPALVKDGVLIGKHG